MTVIEQIADQLLNKKSIIFCGAGISRNSGLPIVDQLVTIFLREMKISKESIKEIVDNSGKLKVPFEYFIEKISENCNTEILYNIYSLGSPNTNHIFISMLFKNGLIKTIVTTNFDNLIENALLMGNIKYYAGKDYDLITNEKELSSINWNSDKKRIIKVHGTISDIYNLDITLSRVSRKYYSKPLINLIFHLFYKGNHDSIIILGYSSSDYFDITPLIESIDKSEKKIFYIQHSEKTKIQDIRVKKDNNPFSHFVYGIRYYTKTDNFVKRIWKLISDDDKYQYLTSKTDWEKYVVSWINNIKKEKKHIKKEIVCSLLEGVGNNKKALSISKQLLNLYLKENKIFDIGMCYNNIGDLYNTNGNIKRALFYLTKALDYFTLDKRYYGICLGNIANSYSLLGSFDKAGFLFRKAFIISKQYNNYENQAICLSGLGTIYLESKKYYVARMYYFISLFYYKRTGDIKQHITLYGNIGYSYFLKGKYSKAILYYSKCLKIAELTNDIEGKSFAYGNIAKNNYRLNKDKLVDKYFQISEEFAHDIGNYDLEVCWIFEVFQIQLDKGNYDEAQKCIKRIEKLLSKTTDTKTLESYHGNFGLLMYLKNKNIKAEEELLKAIKFARKINDREGELTWLANLSHIKLDIHDYVNAEILLRKSLRMANILNDNINKCRILSDIGSLYLNENKFRRSIKYLKRALALARKENDYICLCSCYQDIGHLYNYQKKYSLALKEFKNAYYFAKKKDLNSDVFHCIASIGSCYFNLAKYKLSIKYYEKALNISINNKDIDESDIVQIEEYKTKARKYLLV